MKRYPSYKDSGIEWIGDVPKQWNIKRLKYLDKTIMGQSPESDDCNKDGVGIPFLQGNADFSGLNPNPSVWCESPKKLATKDDILLSVRAPVGAVNIADQIYGIGRGLCAIRPKCSHKKYSYYRALCLSDELNRIAAGSTYTAISVDEVNNVAIPDPAFDEQELLSNFLDFKTDQIDDLIAKKERMIELLQEERIAIINQAVIKGLDPAVEMKDSGIDGSTSLTTSWLGSIPKHWEVKRLKFLYKYIMGQSPESEDCNKAAIGVPFLQGNADFASLSPIPSVWCQTPNKLAERDDVLLSVRAPVGAVNVADQTYGIGRGLCAIRAIESHKKYLYFMTLCLVDVLNSIATGSTYTAVSIGQIANVVLPYPPYSEQKAIADFLDNKTTQIDNQVNREQKSIGLLKEYCTSLISEVVTGKIDLSALPAAGRRQAGVRG